MYKIILILLLVKASVKIEAVPNKVVCYFPGWSVYGVGDGKFTSEDIDVHKCTHVYYAFAGIQEDGNLKVLDQWGDVDSGGYVKVTNLKKKNPKLKVLLSVGGWGEGSVKFSKVAAQAPRRQTLLKSALHFITTYKFDGLDVDWEYPAQRGGSAADKANFIELLKTLRNGFNAQHYLLTVAVSSDPSPNSYDVPALSNVVDFINVMTYDFHSHSDGRTGQNAPLYGSKKTNDFKNCADTSIKNWLAKGARADKLVLGLAFYGRSFKLVNPNNHDLGAKTDGAGNPGPFTKEAGYLGYNEICTNGWYEVWDDEQKVPYKYKGNQWVGFDNPKSIGLKVQYAKAKKLGGVMIWAINTDDFRGKCGPKRGLLSAISL